MPHDPNKLLHDILVAARSVQTFTSGRTLTEYQSDPLLRSAVERQFIIVGEAMTKLNLLDAGLSANINHVKEIIRFRNVLVHGYDVVDDQTVWDTIVNDVPMLIQQVEILLAQSTGP